VRPSIVLAFEPQASPLTERVETASPAAPAAGGVGFLDLYEEHLSFVWNGVRRLGVPESAIEDVVQEVFLVVHRKLGDFEGRSSIRTWLYGIALRVVQHHRRHHRRAGGVVAGDVESLACSTGPSPHESAERSQGVHLLHRLLDEMDDDQREVLVLAELEQMTAPEIAEVTGQNLNTVYWRLRAARQRFERLVLRHQAQKERGLR
jgi:RNA polymerase sigma-70 factor (ECF subfamily)